eukprot:GHRQ01024095.1.p2 GENE.GHRQ01024095.1~~GHRQ01024095.1.p2  ORF type:complete len:105 (-),score=11.71 GHRQ01024095.1:1526-1840(-)
MKREAGTGSHLLHNVGSAPPAGLHSSLRHLPSSSQGEGDRAGTSLQRTDVRNGQANISNIDTRVTNLFEINTVGFAQQQRMQSSWSHAMFSVQLRVSLTSRSLS